MDSATENHLRNCFLMSENKLSRIELRLEKSLLEQIDSLLDGRSRSEWIRRACKAEISKQQIFYVNSVECQDDPSVTPKEDEL